MGSLYNGFSVKASEYDFRDVMYIRGSRPLRPVVDMRDLASAVEEQLNVGSCIGNALVGAYEILLKRDEPHLQVDLSRLFVYYNARLLEGTTGVDDGATVRDGMKALRTDGVCTESLWPYDLKLLYKKPSDEAYADGHRRTIKNYYRLTSVEDMLDALNSNTPVVIGTSTYNGFNDLTASNPIIHKPCSTDMVSGSHAMCLVGYDLEKKLFLVRNSFGTDWGASGYCWITFEFAAREFFDTWIFDVEVMADEVNPTVTALLEHAAAFHTDHASVGA